MSTRPRRTAPAKSYADAADSDVEMDSSGGEGEVKRGGKGGRGRKSRKRANGRDSDDSVEEAASVKSAARKNGAAARKKAPAAVDSDSDDEAPPPKKKRKKASTAKGKKSPAKLEVFNSMPLDILSEICSHLEPRDLLHLTKTSKLFHHVLAASGSKGIWRSARLRIGLPDLTAGDVSETQYAELVFGTGCQKCDGRTTRWEVDYALRQRLCGPCRKIHHAYHGQLNKNFPRIHPSACHCVVPSFASWAFSSIITADPVRLLSSRLEDLEYFSQVLWDLQDLDQNDEDRRASAVKLRNSRTRTRGAIMTDSQPEADACESRVDAFVSGRQGFIAQMRKDSDEIRTAELHHWRVTYAADSAKALRKKNAIRDRRAAIEEKIEELGWSDADFGAGAWRTSTIVNKPEPLTVEVWENIKLSLIKLLARIKAQRGADQRSNDSRRRQDRLQPIYGKLFDSLPQTDQVFLPLFGDFIFLPSVRPFWDAEDATFSQSAWVDSLDELLEDLKEHREAVCDEAAKVILAATNEDAYDPKVDYDDGAFFEKPSSHLFCTLSDCHRDWWERSFSYFGTLPDLLQHQHDVHSDTRFDCLSIGHFKLPVEVASAVSSVVELAGLEEDSATTEELDALGPRFRWDNVHARRKQHTWRRLAATIERRLRSVPKKSSLPTPSIALDPY